MAGSRIKEENTRITSPPPVMRLHLAWRYMYDAMGPGATSSYLLSALTQQRACDGVQVWPLIGMDGRHHQTVCFYLNISNYYSLVYVPVGRDINHGSSQMTARRPLAVPWVRPTSIRSVRGGGRSTGSAFEVDWSHRDFFLLASQRDASG